MPRIRSIPKPVKGFSKRFSMFLDVCEFPTQGRYTWGSKVCTVSINTFRNWCRFDMAPRSIADLPAYVEQLLTHQGFFRLATMDAICAWLVFDICTKDVNDMLQEYHLLNKPKVVVQL